MSRAVILIVLAVVLTACASHGQVALRKPCDDYVGTAASYEQIGLQRLSRGDYRCAVAALQNANDRGAGPTTHLALGYLYQYGLGTDIREDQAKELYEKAMAEGSKRAEACLAVLYMQGFTTPHDLPAAIQLLRDASGAGDAHATADLALAYEMGWGVPQDQAESAWLMNSAGPTVKLDFQEYIAAIRERVAETPTPTMSRHGTVEVDFNLRGGSPLRIQVVKSSGYKDLDDAAVQRVDLTQFLPPDFGYLAYPHYVVDIAY